MFRKEVGNERHLMLFNLKFIGYFLCARHYIEHLMTLLGLLLLLLLLSRFSRV